MIAGVVVCLCVCAKNLCILDESCWRRVFFPQRVSFFASAVCVYTRIVCACVSLYTFANIF